MSDILTSALINNAFWLIIFIVGVTLFRRQIQSLLSSVGTISFAGGHFEFKGDKKATLESYTILTNILLEMLSESDTAKKLGDLISSESARQLQIFIRKYAKEVPREDRQIELQKNVGIIVRRKANKQAAIALFRRLNRDLPDDREIRDELAFTLLTTGNKKDAEEAEKIYRELVHSFGWRHLHHGHARANAALGKFDEAVGHLKTALDMNYFEVEPKMLDPRRFRELEALGGRDDFKKLVAELEAKAKP